tara:strand:+ start:2856 stop:3323 length:468 start_codon:yes stop_codon:yes gene_type:complete
MSIHSWSKAGFSYANNASITNSFSAHAVTADTTNSPESFRVPDICNLQSIEVFFTGLSGAGLSCTLYLSRDSIGDIGVTPASTSGATQAIQASMTEGSAGFVVFAIDTDYHFDSGAITASTESPLAGAISSGTLYAAVKLSTGTGTADIRLNWRA